jgi:hypothetical protein
VAGEGNRAIPETHLTKNPLGISFSLYKVVFFARNLELYIIV